jgi:hypothetical protein
VRLPQHPPDVIRAPGDEMMLQYGAQMHCDDRIKQKREDLIVERRPNSAG